ncbi:pyridoxamine 5'-phosphate oxidase family protein [Olsenella profusa]|uniref:Pyridoxamine 5'-phosphate oxidase family protein n=1 Tax=Olsenella profusa TaxID=138595 RepID=A0ABS2F2J4_9ACTN|nr:pyridoxamine 5'-phosphate oxidase family protein [Olsenella profusa]MBM6775175.1 pyridoxamine 5'-phosphate oxidase family protein [Olsenella profusa]
MFREMRRRNQQLSAEECAEILMRATCGVLAVDGDDDYPYAVPLSYVFDGEKLYFHCARSGHKLDALRRNPRASLCVVDQDQVMPEEFTTYFRSVIVFGTVRELTDDVERRAVAELLGRRFWPEATEEALGREVASAQGRLCVLEMTPEHVTGKEAIELVRARRKAAK